MMETANVAVRLLYELKRTSFRIMSVLILICDDIEAKSFLTISLSIEEKDIFVISSKEGLDKSFLLVNDPLDKIQFRLEFLTLKLTILLFTPKREQCYVVLILILFLIPFLYRRCILESFSFCIIEQFIIIHYICKL